MLLKLSLSLTVAWLANSCFPDGPGRALGALCLRAVSVDSTAVVPSRSGFWDGAHARATAGSVDGYRALSGWSIDKIAL